MSQAADGRPSFVVSIHPGEAGGSPVVEKRAADARSSALLRHERDVLSHLSHPNIIELAGRTPSTASDESATVATFLAGRSTLADHPPTGPAAVTSTAAQLATTLAELHELGWAHGAVVPEHLIVGPDGGIVWCSLRRSTPITTPDAPAATGDVAALVEVIGSLLPADSGRGASSTRRLGAVVSSARNRTPTARRLADELAVLLGDKPATRRPRPALGDRRATRKPPSTRAGHAHRHRPTAPDTSPRRPPGRPVAEVVARLAVCLCAGWLLWRLAPTTTHTARGVSSTGDLAASLRAATDIVRWVGLLASAYGVAINGLTLTALLSRSRQLSAAAGRLGPTVLRRWATGVTSVGILGSAVVSAATQAPAVPTHPASQPVRRTPSSTTPTTTSTTTTTMPPTPTAPLPVPASPAPVIPMVPASVQSPTAGGGATWDTAPGDNLWHIAEETLRSTWNRDPTNTEIARYWQQLLHANHSHMSNPDDPDLIYPGQHFDLPPIAPP